MKNLLLKLNASFHDGKTILVERTLPGASAGDPQTTETWDLTANIVAKHAVLSTPPTTYLLFGTQVTNIKEGKGRIIYNQRKLLVKGTDYDKASAIGAVTTAGYKVHQKDYDDVELNYYLEAEGTVYDIRKDPSQEGLQSQVADDIGALMVDLQEKKADRFWEVFTTAVKSYDATAGVKRTGTDGKTYKVPALHGAVAVIDDATKASAMLDEMFTAAKNLARVGKANGGFMPTCKLVIGGRRALNLKFVINEDTLPLMSHDERWKVIGKGSAIIENGVTSVGTILGIPVITDANMPADTYNWVLTPTGSTGAVAVADEFPEAFGVAPHPTKFLKFAILDGDVAFDAFVTRYMDFAYCGIKKTL